MAYGRELPYDDPAAYRQITASISNYKDIHMATTIRKPKYEKLYRKALVYTIALDIASMALTNVGRINTADRSKLATIVYNKLTQQARSKGVK